MQDRRAAARARVSALLIALFWGLNWPAVRTALGEVSPWTLRATCLGLGAAALFGLGAWRGHRLALPPGRQRLHLVIAGLFNVGFFNLLIAFAQLSTATSRAAIVTYTMPLWTALLARLVLGERIDRRRGLALGLGAAGLVLLGVPLAESGKLGRGVFEALGAGVSWAIGTVYLKWANIEADALALAAWQLAIGAAAIALGLAVFEGLPHFWPLRPIVAVAMIYHALLGIALAYFLWFEVIGRQPAAVAALGTLPVPVIGVLSSALLLGERPSLADLAGFACILAAAALVLLQPAARPPAESPQDEGQMQTLASGGKPLKPTAE